MIKLVRTDLALNLAKSHSGRRRVFFVGEYWWNTVNRPISKRFAGQQVKQHALWYFVLVKGVDSQFLAEIPRLSWWMEKKWESVPGITTGYNPDPRVSSDQPKKLEG